MINHRYKIEELQNSGSFGETYKATDTATGSPVAFTVMRPGAIKSNVAKVAMFERLYSYRKLNHPGALRVLDFGIASNGPLFITTELVEGTYLHNLIARLDHIKPALFLRFMIQLTEVISQAHAEGIVHGNLSTESILVLYRAHENCNIKVLGFDQPDESVLQCRSLGGASKNFAPLRTQHRRRSHLSGIPSKSADIFRIGCIMYQCLTGLPPFLGSQLISADDGNEIDCPQRFKVVRPDLNIPQILEEITFNTLGFGSENGYRTGMELRQELAEIPSRALDLSLDDPPLEPQKIAAVTNALLLSRKQKPGAEGAEARKEMAPPGKLEPDHHVPETKNMATAEMS